MWAITIILLQALTGPETHVVMQAGVFASEDACKASIASSVPGKLDAEAAQQFRDGYRRYVCVRVRGAEQLRPK
ncbi:MAG: hypothetical protein B7X99_13290 [Rhizobiales bacterium 17-65-6]|nr:MAG: hypothetical protein B7Z30_12300 [Rhizobiales bacterium 12-68-15]OYX87617.1 MAG: hypothetical protein B7Y84_11135 [Azorhizobium sp. 32-67-21]OYY13379.1 MAG: hypothetical protein B7Y70_02300 [Rhizobiales bacterium 35-68-8]OYZ97911.1 MAG: hypothetical protein B7X99_13290 [Rhizobiales bacterium 17-65-6]